MSDPTSALRGALAAPVVQHRAAIVEPVPFGALLRAIDGYDGTLVVRSALQLLALTFTRPGELRLATWKELDLDQAVWTIPANRMKMRRPHRIPLAPQTIAILEELRTLPRNRRPVGRNPTPTFAIQSDEDEFSATRQLQNRGHAKLNMPAMDPTAARASAVEKARMTVRLALYHRVPGASTHAAGLKAFSFSRYAPIT